MTSVDRMTISLRIVKLKRVKQKRVVFIHLDRVLNWLDLGLVLEKGLEFTLDLDQN